MAKQKRKTPAEIIEEEKLEAQKLNADRLEAEGKNPTIQVDPLFKNPKEDTQFDEINEEVETEQLLSRFEDIRKYYEESSGGKQSTFYLPEELLQKLKSKVVEDETTITDLFKMLLLEHYFSDRELKDAYLKSKK